MALTKDKKQEIVKKFAKDEKDTGSSEVQIAILTEEILVLVAFRLAVALSKQEIDQDLVPMAEKIKHLDEELKTLLAKK